MTKQVIPEAFYDTLSLAHKLDNFLDGFREEEIHLFSYFSSILYLYAGNPIATWQHQYIVANGYPFSDTINEAIKRHLANGLYEDNGEFYSITARGADEFSKFRKLTLFAKREEYLDAACATSILIPYSDALRALLNEPEMTKVRELNNNSWLEQMNVYPQLKMISEAVGVHTDELVLPAVTWINFLSSNKALEVK